MGITGQPEPGTRRRMLLSAGLLSWFVVVNAVYYWHLAKAYAGSFFARMAEWIPW